jgi:tetratricopeptide (TPR) repeat protein
MVALLGLLAFAFGCNSMQTSSAILRYQQGEFESADSLCGEAIRVNPDDGEAYFYRALSQSMLRNYSGAYTNFRKAAELKPDRAVMAQQNIDHNFAEVFNNGVEAANRDETELAIEYFTTATQANPDNPTGYSNLAKASSPRPKDARVRPGGLQGQALWPWKLRDRLGKENDAVKREETARALAAYSAPLHRARGRPRPFLTSTAVTGSRLFGRKAFGRALRQGRIPPHAKEELYRDPYTYAGEAYGKAANIRRDLARRTSTCRCSPARSLRTPRCSPGASI